MQQEPKANYYLSIALNLCEKMEISLHIFWCSLPYNLCLFRSSAMSSIWDSLKRRVTGIFGTRHTTDEGKSGDENWLCIY